MDPVWIALSMWPIFSLLCWVRKLEKLNFSHFFANLMILLTVAAIVVYATVNMV